MKALKFSSKSSFERNTQKSTDDEKYFTEASSESSRPARRPSVYRTSDHTVNYTNESDFRSSNIYPALLEAVVNTKSAKQSMINFQNSSSLSQNESVRKY